MSLLVSQIASSICDSDSRSLFM